MALGKESFFSRLKHGYAYSARNYPNILLGIGLMSIVLFIFAQPIACVLSYQEVHYLRMRDPILPDFLDLFADFVKNISRYYTNNFMVPANIARQLVYLTFLIFVLPLFMIIMGFQFYSIQEKYEATGLKEQFEKFGKRKRYQETNLDFE